MPIVRRNYLILLLLGMQSLIAKLGTPNNAMMYCGGGGGAKVGGEDPSSTIPPKSSHTSASQNLPQILR